MTEKEHPGRDLSMSMIIPESESEWAQVQRYIRELEASRDNWRENCIAIYRMNVDYTGRLNEALEEIPQLKYKIKCLTDLTDLPCDKCGTKPIKF